MSIHKWGMLGFNKHICFVYIQMCSRGTSERSGRLRVIETTGVPVIGEKVWREDRMLPQSQSLLNQLSLSSVNPNSYTLKRLFLYLLYILSSRTSHRPGVLRNPGSDRVERRSTWVPESKYKEKEIQTE